MDTEIGRDLPAIICPAFDAILNRRGTPAARSDAPGTELKNIHFALDFYKPKSRGGR